VIKRYTQKLELRWSTPLLHHAHIMPPTPQLLERFDACIRALEEQIRGIESGSLDDRLGMLIVTPIPSEFSEIASYCKFPPPPIWDDMVRVVRDNVTVTSNRTLNESLADSPEKRISKPNPRKRKPEEDHQVH
jgi:hypothetical protein